MTPSRRSFLRASALAGAGAVLGAVFPPAGAPSSAAAPDSPHHRPRGPHPAPKRLLILGGTGFIGPHMVRYAVQRGHEVSIFTRGRSEAPVPDVEHLIGDRNGELSALEGRRWDVVLDNNARDYRWVRLTTNLLRDAAARYVLVSSISVYAAETMGYELKDRVLWAPAIDETSPRVRPEAGWEEGQEAQYGLSKALAEDMVHEAFPGRGVVVRPGLIVGPGDPTDRFTYWPVRIDEGGEVLAPGNPDHANQVIDQRDLTEWIVRMAEEEDSGDFNATGPATRMSMAEMLYGIRAVTASPVSFTWVPESFLESQAVRPWNDLPAWVPGDPLSYVSVERAIQAGLTYRPLAVTAFDTLAWDRSRPVEERRSRAAGLTRERERDLLDAWRATAGG